MSIKTYSPWIKITNAPPIFPSVERHPAMRPDPEGAWVAKATAEALENERREARLEAQAAEGVLAMAIARLGGEVEGRPTARVNFLQRVDELRRIEESTEQALSAVHEAWAAENEETEKATAALKRELAEARADLEKAERAHEKDTEDAAAVREDLAGKLSAARAEVNTALSERDAARREAAFLRRADPWLAELHDFAVAHGYESGAGLVGWLKGKMARLEELESQARRRGAAEHCYEFALDAMTRAGAAGDGLPALWLRKRLAQAEVLEGELATTREVRDMWRAEAERLRPRDVEVEGHVFTSDQAAAAWLRARMERLAELESLAAPSGSWWLRPLATEDGYDPSTGVTLKNWTVARLQEARNWRAWPLASDFLKLAREFGFNDSGPLSLEDWLKNRLEAADRAHADLAQAQEDLQRHRSALDFKDGVMRRVGEVARKHGFGPPLPLQAWLRNRLEWRDKLMEAAERGGYEGGGADLGDWLEERLAAGRAAESRLENFRAAATAFAAELLSPEGGNDR